MSTKSYSLPASSAENPFHIYGAATTNPYRVQPFPGTTTRRRPKRAGMMATSAAIATPGQLQPSQVWKKNKNRLDSRTAWLLTVVLFVVTFAMMLAPTFLKPQLAMLPAHMAFHVPSLPIKNPLISESRPAPYIAPTMMAKTEGPSKNRILI